MSHICNYCGNETAGADPCPWCNGSLGVVSEKPKIDPVVIHDDIKRGNNPWPVVGAVLLMLLVAFVLMQQKRNQDRLAAAVRQEPTYIVSNQPLFKGSLSNTPQLAKTASIKDSSLPDVPEKAAAKTEEPDQNDDPATDDSTNQATQTPIQPGSIQLTDVQMASQNDGDGHEMAVGTATLTNNSPYEVTNFNIYISAAGGSFRLEPFSGSVDNPAPYPTRTIPPGGRITLPVMTNGVYTAGDPGATKTVSVEAVENGVTVSSQVTIS